MMALNFKLDVEIWQFCACAMKIVQNIAYCWRMAEILESRFILTH